MSIEVEVGGVYEQAADLTPAGAVIAFAGVNAPSGWLLCDGSVVNRVTYERLFDAIGINFGQGDGSTTFNLPDLQGYFIRGRDNDTGNDPDASSRTASATGGNAGDNVGSKQESAMWGHTFGDGTTGLRNEGINRGSSTVYSHVTLSETKPKCIIMDDGIHGTPNLSSESRPRNVYMNYIIKI